MRLLEVVAPASNTNVTVETLDVVDETLQLRMKTIHVRQLPPSPSVPLQAGCGVPGAPSGGALWPLVANWEHGAPWAIAIAFLFAAGDRAPQHWTLVVQECVGSCAGERMIKVLGAGAAAGSTLQQPIQSARLLMRQCRPFLFVAPFPG